MFLAPMAEISHSAFRRLVADFGSCDWYFTEMLSAAAVTSTSRYSTWYCDFGPFPEKTIVQLAGNNPDIFGSAAVLLLKHPIAGIDINMGCSVFNINKRGWGIELMKDSDLAARIVEKVRSGIQGRTLSVKLRIGEKEDPRALIDFCGKMVSAGADFITLNPRTSKTNRDRPGDWEYVRLLRNELSVPIVGNGEINDFPGFQSRAKKAGTGPVMIGRGAVRKPWLFHLLKLESGNRQSPPPGEDLVPTGTTVDIRETIERYMQYLRKYQPADFQVSRARRFFYYFCDNFKFGTHLKTAVQTMSDLREIQAAALSYLDRNPAEAFIPMK